MIILEKDKNSKNKVTSLVITSLLLLFTYYFLSFASISDPEGTRIYISQLTQFNIAQIQQIVPPETEQAIETQVEQDFDEVETIESEQVSITSQRVDILDMLRQNTEVITSMSNQESDVRMMDADQVYNEPSLRITDINHPERIGIQTLEGTTTSIVAGSRRMQNNDLNGTSIGLAEGSGLSTNRRDLHSDVSTGGLLGDARTREDILVGNEVSLRNLSDFGADYSDMEPIIHDLIRWMRDNPATLPAAVRRAMTDGRWGLDYLTSRVLFFIGERQFDLLLMCKEADLEVHIFLIEERSDVTYLIDSGFRQQSNSMRRGGVDYYNEDIVQVDSQMRPAGRQQTEQFYQIFLSWWNSLEIE